VRHQFAFQIRASELVVVQDAEASKKKGKSKPTRQRTESSGTEQETAAQ
jgi:hypothetical protein